MFLTFKKKTMLIILCALFVLASVVVCFTAIRATFKPTLAHTIVIDAGHGGMDGGAEGDVTGITESELNLDYALVLKNICQQYGWKVVLTRSDMNGLYSSNASNKKRSEMEKRKSIIEAANADVVVSIHMNSFSMSSVRGAQVYYADGSDSGEALAESVQSSLAKNVEYAKSTAKVGDYYILNCTDTTSILVECGFLSNPEEEILLQDETYMQSFCYHLFCGVLAFYNYE